MTSEQRQHMIDTAPSGGEIIFLEDMPFADVKAIFAADGTFNVNPDHSLTLADSTTGPES